MKTAFLAALMTITLRCFSQDSGETVYDTYTHDIGSTAYLLGDSIHIRKEPSTGAVSVAQLPIGTRLKIIGQSDMRTQLNGFFAPWYLVEFGKKQRGYVWGGKLAINSFRSTDDPELVFHFGLEKQINNDSAVFQIRIERNHTEIRRYSFGGYGNAQKQHECINYGNKGLNNVRDVIYVQGYGQFCGDNAGSSVFFWDGSNLHFVRSLYRFSDVPYFASERFFFPCDIEGTKDRILLYEEIGEYAEYEDPDDYRSKPDYVYEKQETTAYRWDGRKLIPAK